MAWLNQGSRSHLAGARKEIESALEAGIRDGFELLTPARALRGLQTGDGPASSSEADDSGKGEDEDSPGLLDDFAVIEDGLDEMTADMEAMMKTIETIGALTEQSGTDMLDLTQANAPMSARLAAVARYAETISEPAGELNTVAAAFAERMATLDSGVLAALGLIEMTPPDQRGEGTEEFLEQLMSLDEAAQDGLAQIGSFGASAGAMVRVSRHLRKPVKEITAAVKQLTSAITRMGEWATKARALAHSATA
ncbi:hypothetical protein ACF1HU_00485 [Streptomyces olivaceus]|uniref:hypothetical protein n=1 Tax=Streptomyces olivaceus TaxID=47716 RepID=UPI003677D9F0